MNLKKEREGVYLLHTPLPVVDPFCHKKLHFLHTDVEHMSSQTNEKLSRFLSPPPSHRAFQWILKSFHLS